MDEENSIRTLQIEPAAPNRGRKKECDPSTWKKNILKKQR